MRQRYVAVELLRHGPLGIHEFMEITGWKSYKRTHQVLAELVADGFLKRVRVGVYAVKEGQHE